MSETTLWIVLDWNRLGPPQPLSAHYTLEDAQRAAGSAVFGNAAITVATISVTAPQAVLGGSTQSRRA